MSELNYPWLEELSLNKQDFAKIPEGETPLTWGFRNALIDESAYLTWASHTYQIPAIKREFFDQKLDLNLVEKHKDLHAWNVTCFPVYMWKDTLFIACLEPVNLSTDIKTCFVVAPFSAMEAVWNQNFGEQPQALAPSPEAKEPEVEQKLELPELPDLNIELKPSPVAETVAKVQQETVVGGQDDSNQTAAESNATSPQNNNQIADLDALSFSGIDGEEFATVAEPAMEEKTQADPTMEPTGTIADDSINNFTSATQTMHIRQELTKQEDSAMSELAFDNVDIDGISLEGDSPKQEITEVDTPPVPQETKSHPGEGVRETTVLNPKINTGEHKKIAASQEEQETTLTDESIRPELTHSVELPNRGPSPQAMDDDYTPLPFLTQAEQAAQQPPPAHTVTDLSVPVFVPPKNKISDQELAANQELDTENHRKDVIAHIFHHLRRDYKKLMWVEFTSDTQYFPKYCYGDWFMDAKAWEIHVNITQPNMFRIAHKSGLPFHGEISDNPFNDKYFELWTNSRKPSFATVFPLAYDDMVYGFIVGFSKGSEFDIVSSLKKIENLASIVKTHFLSAQHTKVA